MQETIRSRTPKPFAQNATRYKEHSAMSTEQTLFTDTLNNTIDAGWPWLREHGGFWRHSAAG